MAERLVADRRVLTVSGIIVALVLFLAINVLATASLRTARVDLTENALFTLSPGTVEVLEGIDEPVTLRLFISNQLTHGNPLFARYADRVRELLETYEKLSNGKLNLEIYHPAPYSTEEDIAVASGLRGVPYSAEGELVYFGVVGSNSTDDEDKIGFMSPEREDFLEYDLTRLVYNLANPKKKVVGLLSSMPIYGTPQNQYRPWVVYTQMEQFFKVQTLFEDSTEIGVDEIDILMLAQIDKVKPETLYAVDQFLLRGGRAMMFADPNLETPTGKRPIMPGMPAPSDCYFWIFFESWGIKLSKGIVGDAGTAQRINFPTGDRTVQVQYLPWLGLRTDNFNSEDVTTAHLQFVTMSTTGHVELAEGSGLKLDPLLRSSDQAMEIEASKIAFRPNPLALIEEFKPSGRGYVMAARVSGNIKSIFPDGPPMPVKDEPKGADDAAKKKAEDDYKLAMEAYEKLKKNHVSESQQPVNIILVADADMLADDYWVRVQEMNGQQLAVPFANNADFVLNALDNLAGSGSVISLRSRGLSDRPFTLVDEIRARAELKYRAKERELETNLRDIEGKIKDIRTDEKSGSVVLTSQQQNDINQFQSEMLSIRAELRNVQHALRSDIESLDTWTRVINIALVPLIVAFIAVAIALVRRVRYSRRFETG
ncbi:MAG: Gldg family protein [Proteobacteria bacterium]|nr:Gldg family protein [Pseudomonadota bacterium]